MSLLAGTHYDPATRATWATTAAAAMTAFDTTNLRLTFTAPSSGKVVVRISCTTHGATSYPSLLLGVLDGSTVRGRQACGPQTVANQTNTQCKYEAQFVVNGLTPGNSYTWDAAYGIETGIASSAIKAGGPDNTTAGDASGGLSYEIWDADDCLASVLYDPATAGGVGGTAAAAMTAMSTTNLRNTFTAPANGTVLVRLRGCVHGTTANTCFTLGVLDGSTVRGRQVAAHFGNRYVATVFQTIEATFLVTGLTGGNSYSLDAAWGIDGYASATSGLIKWGGPNNGTANDAFGAFSFEVWKVT